MQFFNMRSKEWVFLDTKGQRRSLKDAIKVARRRPPDRKKCTRRKNEKRKRKKKLLKHCTWILEVFVAANPRLEVVLSSVDGPPSSSSGSIFMGRGGQKLVGGWRVPAPGRSWKKKDALESERAGGCRRKWGAHCIAKCINFLINYA